MKRLENMRERQAMLEMLSMEEEKEELRALVPKRESKKVRGKKADTLAMQGNRRPTNGLGWVELVTAPSGSAGGGWLGLKFLLQDERS